MKLMKITLYLISLLLFVSCSKTVEGNITRKSVSFTDRRFEFKLALTTNDTIYFLDFSEKKIKHKGLEKLPYPTENGIYKLPKGVGAQGLILENGDVLNFASNLKYKVSGKLISAEKAGIDNSKFHDKEQVLIKVKKVVLVD